MSRSLVQFSNLFKSFDTTVLFEDISLSFCQGEIFALIGENGSGKTTLLKLLTGDVQPDAGVLTKASRLTIGYLPQEIGLISERMSARDFLGQGPFLELEERMAMCLDREDRLAEWEALHEHYEQLGGYRRLPIEKMLDGLKVEPSLLDLPMGELSGGQRKRVALAKVLMDNPDLLLLDEPTNHLDQEMFQWLRHMLYQREGATVIVSHDRKFLNETCNRLIELKQGKLTCFGGNYDFYLSSRERLLEKQVMAYEEWQEERVLLKQKIKAMGFSKSKASCPTDRNLMAYDARGEGHQQSQRRTLAALKRRLEEIEAYPVSHPRPKSIKGLRFNPTLLTSSVAIEVNEMSKSYGGKVLFSGFNKKLCKGDRIVITGSNGSGKTTLLSILAGLRKVDGGEIRHAPTTKIGYLDQEVELLPMEKTPFQYFESQFSFSEEELRKELHKAALGGVELLHRPFSTLSVGQRKRLMLLSLVLEKPNVLLLDEPTNHLDLLTVEALEEALLRFEGAILAVSHDAMFIEKIATEVWVL